MKKLMSLALVGTMVAGLMSPLCVQAATDVSTLDPEGVELNILCQSQPQHEDLVNNYLQKFADEHGIKVNIEMQASTGYADMMNLALAEEDQGYDLVMFVATNCGSIMRGGWVMPLDDFINAEEEANTEWYQGIMTTALDACVLEDGHRYGIGYGAGPMILMYNKTMFEEAGITELPKTMDEVLELAPKLTDPEKGQYGLAFRGGNERGIEMPWITNWMLQGGDWCPEDADNYAVFDTDMAVKASEQLIEMYKYAPEGIFSYAYQEALSAMQQGMCAMWVDLATMAANLRDPKQTELYDQFGFAAMDGVQVPGDGWCFAIAKNTEYPEWCWEMIKCATSYDTALGQIMNGTAVSCYRNDVYENQDIYTVLPQDLCDAVNKAASMAQLMFAPVINQSDEIRTELKNNMYSAIKGDITAEEAMEKTQASAIDILERDGVEYKK